ARTLQRVLGRGAPARRGFAEAQWRSLQKQTADLATLKGLVDAKGQSFVAPCKVLLALLRRAVWLAESHGCSSWRKPKELADVLGILAGFASAGLRAPLASVQQSLCHQLLVAGAESSGAKRAPRHLHEPCAGRTLRHFADALLAAACSTSASPASVASLAARLAELLAVDLWAAGAMVASSAPCDSAVVDSSSRDEGAREGVRQLADGLLASAAEAPRLQAWRAAAAAAAAAWPAGAEAPARLQALVAVAVAVAWLQLGLSQLLLAKCSGGEAAAGTWEAALAVLLRPLFFQGAGAGVHAGLRLRNLCRKQ
ncbi:unnamed protein product, partial [Polarella glacialis]